MAQAEAWPPAQAQSTVNAEVERPMRLSRLAATNVMMASRMKTARRLRVRLDAD
jgi:hypothetical protein